MIKRTFVYDKHRITGITISVYGKKFNFDLDGISEEMKALAMWYGFAQKLKFSYVRIPVTKESTDLILEKLNETTKALKKGLWEIYQGEKKPYITRLAYVLAGIYGKDPEECQLQLSRLTKNEREELKRRPDIKDALTILNMKRRENPMSKSELERELKAVNAELTKKGSTS